jgi:hypothetical protein
MVERLTPAASHGRSRAVAALCRAPVANALNASGFSRGVPRPSSLQFSRSKSPPVFDLRPHRGPKAQPIARSAAPELEKVRLLSRKEFRFGSPYSPVLIIISRLRDAGTSTDYYVEWVRAIVENEAKATYTHDEGASLDVLMDALVGLRIPITKKLDLVRQMFITEWDAYWRIDALSNEAWAPGPKQSLGF